MFTALAPALSFLLVIAGAILAFAVDATPAHVNLTAVGVILMLTGLVGALASGLRAHKIDQLTEERVHTGTAAPMPVDEFVLVDRESPIIGETRGIGDGWQHDAVTDTWHRVKTDPGEDPGGDAGEGPAAASAHRR